MSTLGGPPKKGGSTLGGPPKQSGSTLGAPPKQGGSTLGGPPKKSGSTLGAPPKQGGSTLGGPPKASGSTLGAPPKKEEPKTQEEKPVEETRKDQVTNDQNNVENDEAPKESASKKKKKKGAKKTSAPAPAPAPKKGGKRSALAEKIKKQLEEKERLEREEQERIKREEEEERLRLEQLKKEEEERKRLREEKRKQQMELEKLRKEQQKREEIERKRQEVLARYSGTTIAAPKKMSFKKKSKKKQDQQQVNNNNVEAPKQVTDTNTETEKPDSETSTTEVEQLNETAPPTETKETAPPTETKETEPPTETKSKVDSNLRSPICCVLGHVDAGKTKLLDKLRNTNVQEGEIGGITQQIGATFFPIETIHKIVASVESERLSLKVPGLLVMDTPGHASFSNLRMRGTSICDIAILVVDIHSGLQQQTIESIKMLRMKKTPFIVAVNKVDRLYGWKHEPYRPIRKALKAQEAHTLDNFKKQINNIIAQFANENLNAQLYYNFKSKKDFRTYFSLVPISAQTGEGIPDLVMLLIQFSQMFLQDRLMKQDELQCSVLEVKVVEGLGTTIDVILRNGTLRRNDKIMLCGLNGPIVTTIRALKTPPPLSEIRVKSKLKYTDNNEVTGAIGLKIVAPGLEGAIAGSQIYVINKENEDKIEELERKVMEPLESIKKRVEQTTQGVYVQASSLGSLEALLDFLKTECDIPVSKVGIGPLHKKDLMTALALRDTKEEYGCILAFDIKVSNEIREMAENMDIRIFEADVIYHLQDMYKDFLDEILERRRQEEISKCYFPCILKILPQYIIHKAKPIILGVKVLEGDLKLNAPFAVWSESRNGWLELGRVFAIEKDNKPLNEAKAGDEVAVSFTSENNYEFGRQFDERNKIVSVITRESLDLLKIHFKDYCKENLKLLFKLRNTFIDGKSGSWSIGD